MHFIRKVNIYLVFIILIIFGIFQYGINKICGFTLVPDEFGYWASAAGRVGYNWSPIASLGSYYSFGYSFVLIPILKLFQNGVTAYRAAVGINMLLMCGSVFLMQGILKRIFPESDEIRRVFVCGIAVLYPSWIFYMQMTMAEALLMFLFVLITYLFLCLMKNAKVMTAVCLAASLIYIYCVHMRTVGILIACVITLVFWMAMERPEMKVVLAFWGTLLLLLLLAVALKQSTIDQVFSGADAQVLAGNDYGSQWGKFKQIFTARGMIQLVKEAGAKLFYLGLASFGIFYWGIVWAVKELVSLVRKFRAREKRKAAEWIALFLILSAAGEILISSIYMYQGKLIDTLIYGRYDEFIVPVFLLAGIAAMSRSRWIFPGTLLMGTGTGLFIPVILNYIEAKNMDGIRGYMVAGISYLLKEENLNVYLFFRDTWILGFGVMFITAFLVWAARKSSSAAWLLSGIIVFEIAAGLQISHHYTYRVNNSNFMDLYIVEEIRDKIDPEDRVAYLDEGKPEYIDFIQMQLRDKTIEVIQEEAMPGENDPLSGEDSDRKGLFLITHIDTRYKDELDKMFDTSIRSNTFYLYYNKESYRKGMTSG